MDIIENLKTMLDKCLTLWEVGPLIVLIRKTAIICVWSEKTIEIKPIGNLFLTIFIVSGFVLMVCLLIPFLLWLGQL